MEHTTTRAVLLFTGLAALAVPGPARLVPHTPCPKIFNYFESETYEIFGAMTFPNDFGGVYDLEVNMSIAADTNENIRIFRKTPDYRIQNGDAIEYYVLFPYNHTFPKLTSVRFNGKVYCVGPPEEAKVTTALSKRDILRAKVVQGVAPSITTPLATPRPPQRTTPSAVQIQININNKVSDGECGINVDFRPLVVQGQRSKEGEYPWLVPLFYLEQDTYKFRCGGTLISNRHVVTAAHCVSTLYGTDLDKDNMLVVFGRHSIKNWAIKSTIRAVKKLIVHPDYVQVGGDGDIAVVVVDKPVTFGVLVRPVCLWDEEDDLSDVVGEKGVVTGWGKDENGKDYVNEPRQVAMPIISQEVCLRSDPRFLRLTSTRTFCAGDKSGSAPCTGDSGGGFVMKRNGRWKLRGVVSTALLSEETRSCDVHNYVVFADVPKYNKWLKNVLDD